MSLAPSHLLLGSGRESLSLTTIAFHTGLKYKKGPFSKAEDATLLQALENYKKVRQGLPHRADVFLLFFIKPLLLSQAHGLSDDDLDRVVFAKGKKEREDNANFWSEISGNLFLRCLGPAATDIGPFPTASKLDERPIIALYHHVRRLRHPLKAKGPWTPAEDAALKA